ncbi:hypothetical protein HDV00_000841 [Rhizophlyctis rosea]|nr:hypothetical protein HDV00_000841 [Rhizophlyctis rosea]
MELDDPEPYALIPLIPTSPTPQKRLRTLTQSHYPHHAPQIAEASELHYQPLTSDLNPHGGLVQAWAAHSWPPLPRDSDETTSPYTPSPLPEITFTPPLPPSHRKRKASEPDSQSLTRATTTPSHAHTAILAALESEHKSPDLARIESTSDLAHSLLSPTKDAWRHSFASIALRELTRIAPPSQITLLTSSPKGDAIASAFRWIHALEDSAPLQQSWQAAVGKGGDTKPDNQVMWDGEEWTLFQSWTLYHSLVQALLLWHLTENGVTGCVVDALRSLL